MKPGCTYRLGERARPGVPDVPVIVTTGELAYYTRKGQFTEAGAAVFLAKPFGTGQLLEAIRGLLAATAKAS